MILPLAWATRRSTRRAIVWLLAVLLALQGLGVGVLAAQGPAHVHRAPSAGTMTVWRVDASAQHGRWFVHAHDESRRHHHAADDASVVRVEPERLADAAGEAGTLALDIAIAAFVALVLQLLPWAAGDRRAQRNGAGAGWQPSFTVPRSIERPPRPG